MAENLTKDNLISHIVSYKLRHYNCTEYDKNSVLKNKNSLKHNMGFVNHVVDNGYFTNMLIAEDTKKIYVDKIKYLAELVQLDEIDLLVIVIQRLSNKIK